MNRIIRLSLSGLLAATIVTPAFAERSDRAFVEEMRMQINAARSEPGVARAGAAELAEAERRLPELAKAMDDNETEDARASRDGINALIDAARMRARPIRAQAATAPAAYTPPAQPKRQVRHVAYRPAKPKPACTLASR